MRWRAWMFVAAYALLCGLIYGVFYSADVNEYVQNTITFALGQVVGWIAMMISYEFGSTRTSQAKDATISALSATPSPAVTEPTKAVTP
tara:strand:- start:1285 stop:1551 length:267 start_codon:yes stop_codon:yes gene_type:complete